MKIRLLVQKPLEKCKFTNCSHLIASHCSLCIVILSTKEFCPLFTWNIGRSIALLGPGVEDSALGTPRLGRGAGAGRYSSMECR